MGRVKILLMVVCLMFALPFAPAGAEEGEKKAALYFFENICATCHPEQDFVEEFRQLTGEPLSNYRYEYANVFESAGRVRYEAEMQARGIPKERQLLPMLILGDTVYPGSSAISASLPFDALEISSEGTTSRLLYFYLPACEGCQRAKAAIDALGGEIAVTRGGHVFSSPVEVYAYDMSQNIGMANALFEKYGVPDAKRVAPIVFLRDRYLSGADAIETMLRYWLERGDGVGQPWFAAASSGELPAIGFARTILAGLVAGVNPCSLSMLLMLFSLLLVNQSRLWRYALSFLAGKFLSYLAVGFLLFRVMERFQPPWLPLVSKVLLTCVAALFVAGNLWDWFAAKSQKYGSIRLQLPAPLRRFNHEMIKSAMDARVLPLALFLLGIVIAGGEFLCTGQVYLATLLSWVEQGGAVPYLHMLLYAAAFIFPPLAVTFVVARGRRALEVSESVRRALPAIKLITALLFAVLAIYAWI